MDRVDCCEKVIILQRENLSFYQSLDILLQVKELRRAKECGFLGKNHPLSNFFHIACLRLFSCSASSKYCFPSVLSGL